MGLTRCCPSCQPDTSRSRHRPRLNRRAHEGRDLGRGDIDRSLGVAVIYAFVKKRPVKNPRPLCPIRRAAQERAGVSACIDLRLAVLHLGATDA